jgi:hypothetical protein
VYLNAERPLCFLPAASKLSPNISKTLLSDGLTCLVLSSPFFRNNRAWLSCSCTQTDSLPLALFSLHVPFLDRLPFFSLLAFSNSPRFSRPPQSLLSNAPQTLRTLRSSNSLPLGSCVSALQQRTHSRLRTLSPLSPLCPLFTASSPHNLTLSLCRLHSPPHTLCRLNHSLRRLDHTRTLCAWNTLSAA